MKMEKFTQLAIKNLDDFIYGVSPDR